MNLCAFVLRVGVALALGAGLALGACGGHERTDPGISSVGPGGSAGRDSSELAPPVAGEAGEMTGELQPLESARALGAACVSNADCGAEGLTCLGADQDLGLGLAAVPGGLCTATCSTDAECQAFGRGAVCAKLTEAPLAPDLGSVTTAPRYCMAGCAPGAPGGASKCHARGDLSCRPFAPPRAQRCAATAPACPDGLNCFRGYCREFACGPRCNGDTDCSAGRTCDVRSGLCTQAAVPATPIGLFCDPDAPSSPCRSGSCLVLFDENNVKTGSFCTQSCVLGAPCANGRGACRLPRFSDYEVGDVGYCQPTCDCNADCQLPGDECIAWGDPDAEQLYGSKGVCEHATGEVSLDACGAGGAAGARN